MATNFAIVSQFIIGLVFLLSSANALKNPVTFAQGIADYDLLSASFSPAAAILIIVLELWIAFTHLSGLFLEFGSPTAMLLLVIFGVAVAINLGRGRNVHCHCFGSRELISIATLLRLVLLSAGETFVLRFSDEQLLSHLSRKDIALGMFWAIFLAVVFLWISRVNDLMRLLMLKNSEEVQEGRVP